MAKTTGQRFRRPVDKRVLVGGAIFGLLIVMSTLAPLIMPHDPNAQDLLNRMAPPSTEHPLGTDELGRDTLSRLMLGGRVSLGVGALSVGFGGLVGTLVGVVAGYTRGWFDIVVMRLVDGLLAFPLLLVALIVVATLGPSMTNLVWAIAIGVFPRFVRLVRGATIDVADRDFVTASKVVGTPLIRLLRVEILPNIASPTIVTATFMLATAILIEASLGFLGLGVQPPIPTWGNMINEALPRVRLYVWGTIYPGAAIMTAVLALNLVGDGWRDLIDRRLR